MQSFVRDGDTVLVHPMDRLARNLDDLRRVVRTLTGKGVRVEFVKESLTFTGEDSPMTTLLLSVMGAFAEFERALILERHREGIAAAGERKSLLAKEFDIGRPCTATCGPAAPTRLPRWSPAELGTQVDAELTEVVIAEQVARVGIQRAGERLACDAAGRHATAGP
jgi:hypothetical protein